MDELGSSACSTHSAVAFASPCRLTPPEQTRLPLPWPGRRLRIPRLASPCAPWPDPSSCCCRLRAPMTTVAMAATAAGADALCAPTSTCFSRLPPRATGASPPTALSTLQRSASDTSRAAVGINTTLWRSLPLPRLGRRSQQALPPPASGALLVPATSNGESMCSLI